MIEKILDPIFAPFRYLRGLVFNIKQGPARVKGEISRAKSQAAMVKGDFMQYQADAKELKGKAGQAQQKFGVAPGQPGAQQGRPGAPGAAGGAANAQFAAAAGGTGGAAAQNATRPAKMGLFSKKKKCPGCGQKLHASWGECPYCGWGKTAGGAAAMAGGGGMMAPSPSPSKQQRTMALDLNAPPPTGPISDGLVGWFIPLEGRQSGELFQIRGRMTIGKANDCDIVIAEDSVSGHHAEFVPTSNGFRLNDLGSTNGTYVNDKRVTTHDLVDNDNVKLGRINFKYKAMV